MALSTLKNLLACQHIRRGDGLFSLPESRRRERLFRDGRTSLKAAGVKNEKLGADYQPENDTCIKAFVRLIALRAQEIAPSASNE
eukprot:CAMPEP_0119302984 /NCGR_PEP_ID=MMETSP1333-20130426/4497_1 /TAXON_ID=418940 /ORGANISM="Scyphosphaera apsteinii, Strain RCC1455" /LENGTH=84 /DNA_ID=CAMNT_0007305527 /DNA_START=145 /DNA_END=399 /DNA_ORIENTATION=-